MASLTVIEGFLTAIYLMAMLIWQFANSMPPAIPLHVDIYSRVVIL